MHARVFRRFGAAVAAAVVLTHLVAACGDGTDGGSAGTPRSGGTLTVALGGDPITLNPHAVSANSRDVTRTLVDSLLALDPATKKPVPWLAKSYEANTDTTQFTFQLREGVTFADGTPFNAQAVKANFDDIIANKAANTGAATVTTLVQAGYLETQATGELTVVQRFSKPNPVWPLVVTSTLYGILAPATLALPFADRFNKIIGTGPFVLDSYIKNSEIRVSRRQGYNWPPQQAQRTGDAYLDKVVFKVIAEPSVRSGALKTGQVQVATSVNPQDIKSLDAVALPVVTRPIPRFTEALVVTGADRSPLNDRAVRQALVKAVSTAEIRDALLNPAFKLPTSYFTSSVVGHADQSALLAPDAAGAGKLLDGAGWLPGADGIRQKDGRKLTLVFGWIQRGNPWDQGMVELLKAQLAKVGIDLRPRLDTAGQAVAALQSHNQYDLFLGGASGDITGDVRNTLGNAAPNLYNIQDAELQPLVQQQAVAADPAAREQILAAIQARVAGEGLVVPLVEDTAVVGLGKNVQGFDLDADARMPSLRDVWLS